MNSRETVWQWVRNRQVCRQKFRRECPLPFHRGRPRARSASRWSAGQEGLPRGADFRLWRAARTGAGERANAGTGSWL